MDSTCNLVIFLEADRCFVAWRKNYTFRASKSLCSLTTEHSAPNKTGNKFSDINLSTGVINSSKPSIVRKSM